MTSRNKSIWQKLKGWFSAEKEYADITRLLCDVANANVRLAEENCRQLADIHRAKREIDRLKRILDDPDCHLSPEDGCSHPSHHE